MLEIKPVKLKKRSQPINILSEKKVKFFIKLHNKEELSSDWKVLWRKIWTNSEYGGGETSGILQDEGPPADSLPVSVIKPQFAAGRSRAAQSLGFQVNIQDMFGCCGFNEAKEVAEEYLHNNPILLRWGSIFYSLDLLCIILSQVRKKTSSPSLEISSSKYKIFLSSLARNQLDCEIWHSCWEEPAAKTKTIIPVASLPAHRSSKLELWIPINHPGGGDCATEKIKETVEIAKSYTQLFIEKIDPGNKFFLKNGRKTSLWQMRSV